MPKVHFVKEKKTIEVPDGANLRKEARRNGVEVYWGPHRYAHCPGLGLCTSCKVLIRKGAENVSPQGTWERMNLLLNPLGFFARVGHEEDMRLACQTTVHGDVEVETQPGINWHGERFWA